LVRGVGVSDSGRETPGTALPFDAHPGDDDPVDRVEGVTLEREAAPTCRQNDYDRFALHAPTLVPRGVTTVTISSQQGSNSSAAQ